MHFDNLSRRRPGQNSRESTQIEIWGGVECTCNRVGNRYIDQMELSGHARRVNDFEPFAQLGLRTLRVGMLWERSEWERSWHWADRRLRRFRELGLQPIVGLVHHGSGPLHTDLHDAAFPEKLAIYAAKFAKRYPWVNSYTPVNEPHTTARFSSLYGIWHPHTMSRPSYLRALLNQIRATVLSMEAVRRVRPDAQLVQTEDVGSVSGTQELGSLCEMLNLRRWLSFDLLCGKVDRNHPMFDYMRNEGISEAEIDWFSVHACPPDVVGINYYVTSDRFLDHRLELYPNNRRSAEGPFVDVEAVRVPTQEIAGVGSLLNEAWRRYRLPVAITEVHLGGAVAEQIRWLAESWHQAVEARARGVNCPALTVWALLGSFYWDELVTRENGHYEPGVFDVRSGTPEATELADVVAQIACGMPPSHPALAHAGWWRQEGRVCYPCAKKIAA